MIRRRTPEDLARIDAWLQRLDAEHPMLFSAITVGVAAVLLVVVWLICGWGHS